MRWSARAQLFAPLAIRPRACDTAQWAENQLADLVSRKDVAPHSTPQRPSGPRHRVYGRYSALRRRVKGRRMGRPGQTASTATNSDSARTVWLWDLEKVEGNGDPLTKVNSPTK